VPCGFNDPDVFVREGVEHDVRLHVQTHMHEEEGYRGGGADPAALVEEAWQVLYVYMCVCVCVSCVVCVYT